MKLIHIHTFIILLLLSLSQGAIAKDLTIKEILNNQDKYDGKKVSVLGIPYGSYEGAYIHDNKGNTLWLGLLPSSIDITNIQESYGSMSRAKGTFRKAGSIPGSNLYLSERIEGITLLEPLQKDGDYNRLGYDLQAIIEVDGKRNAMLVDFRSGKGYKAKTGDNIRGLFEKKIISILKDRILVEEKCPQCKGSKTRRFEVLIKND